MMINSSLIQSDSPKHDLENFNDINNNNNNSIDCSTNTMKQDSLSLNDATLLTTTTTTTVEVKVKTTSRKRKLNIINNNNNNKQEQQQQVVTKKQKKQCGTKNDDNDESLKDKTSKKADQSSLTDESSFGSCEPGTNIVLQGIVWNETDKGVLVVNITWRGKTYVGALLNTTEQNWAPPRYKNDIRPNKQNINRDQQLTTTPTTSTSHDSTERILRNGKRRGTSMTVTPSPTTKTKSFKIPETPTVPTTKPEKSVISSEDVVDDETGDNDSSRSVSPTTSGTSSTTSSSSPPLNQPAIDLSKSNTNVPYHHFPNDILFPSSANPSDYFSSLHASTNSFSLPSFNKLSSTTSTSSYLPIPFLTNPSYSSVTSLSKSSH